MLFVHLIVSFTLIIAKNLFKLLYTWIYLLIYSTCKVHYILSFSYSESEQNSKQWITHLISFDNVHSLILYWYKNIILVYYFWILYNLPWCAYILKCSTFINAPSVSGTHNMILAHSLSVTSFIFVVGMVWDYLQSIFLQHWIRR